MTQTLTITKQWQIYLPQDIRKALKLTSTSRFKAQIKDKQLILTPQESPILKMAGKLKKYHQKNPIDIDNLRDHIDWTKA